MKDCDLRLSYDVEIGEDDKNNPCGKRVTDKLEICLKTSEGTAAYEVPREIHLLCHGADVISFTYDVSIPIPQDYKFNGIVGDDDALGVAE